MLGDHPEEGVCAGPSRAHAGCEMGLPTALWLLPCFQQGGLLPSRRVALWIRPSQALFSLSACPAPKEGIAETRKVRAFTKDLHTYVGALLIFSPGFCPFLVVFIPDLVYGCGGEKLWLQELRWSYAATRNVAASVALFSQDGLLQNQH